MVYLCDDYDRAPHDRKNHSVLPTCRHDGVIVALLSVDLSLSPVLSLSLSLPPNPPHRSQTLYDCSPSSGLFVLKNLKYNTVLSEVMDPVFPMKKYNKNIDEKDLKRLEEFIVTKVTRLEAILEISKLFLIFLKLKTLMVVEVG